MKFAEHLSAHITPEWRKQYVSYEELKSRIYFVVEKAPSPESVEPDVLVRYFTTFDEEFFQLCEKELTNINTFFSEKLAEATRKYSNLLAELKNMKRDDGKKKTPSRKMPELKLAFSEYYLSLILLQNYQNLNFTGFRKILKKHDKILAVNTGAKWREQNVDTSTFYTSKEIDRLIGETETTVTTELEGGDRQRAMKKLRVPPLNEQKSPWTTFKVGLFSGSFIVLFIAAVLSAIFHEKEHGDLTVAFRLYRGPFLLVEFLFLLGINVYGWRSSGVNHVLIFELDPRSHLSEQDLMEIASIFGVVWTLSLLSFLFSASLSIPPYVNPLALTLTMLLFLANPAKVFRHEARFWVLRVLGRIVTAPFFHVGFADFWLADQLNSLAAAFLDMHYLVCFYSYSSNWVEPSDTAFCMDNSYIWRPLVNCLPAWFRFAQCVRRYYDTREAFPHLANAAKYSTTFFVVAFASLMAIYKDTYEDDSKNPYFYLWVVSSIISSCYTYTWDIRMDWGLFEVYDGDNKFLREEIVYNSTASGIVPMSTYTVPRSRKVPLMVFGKQSIHGFTRHLLHRFYYFAIVEDFILRFAWVATYLNKKLDFVSYDILSTLLPPLEVFRRFVWNFFRLENEHLNNCGKFRAVRDISVAPLHSSDAATIEKMMDEEDGVINRRKRKLDTKKVKEDKIQLVPDSRNKL